MRSAVWVGDWPVTQPWGATSLLVEPYWPAAQAHWHCGIDLGMPTGTALHALRAGHLTARGTGYLGILTSSGEVDWYLHGVYAPLGYGAFVAAGQWLGSSSNVAPSGGFVTGPHLHFEVQAAGGRLNNPATSLDPVPILAGHFGASGNHLEEPMTPQIANILSRLVRIVSTGHEPDLPTLNADLVICAQGDDVALNHLIAVLAQGAGQPGQGTAYIEKTASVIAGAGGGAAVADDDSALCAAVQAAQSAADAAQASASKIEAAVKAAGAQLSQA